MELSEFEEMGCKIYIGDNKQFLFERVEKVYSDAGNTHMLFIITFFESSSVYTLYSGTCFENAVLIWDAIILAYGQGVRDEYKKSRWGVPATRIQDSGSIDIPKEPVQNEYSMEEVIKEIDMGDGVYFYDGNIGGINRDWRTTPDSPSYFNPEVTQNDLVDCLEEARRACTDELINGVARIPDLNLTSGRVTSQDRIDAIQNYVDRKKQQIES